MTVAALLVGLTATATLSCSSGRSGSPTGRWHAPGTASVSPAPTPTRTSAPQTTAAGSGAEGILRRLTEAQRVGQLFMVGSPAASASAGTLSAISGYHAGNVMLTGRGYGGTPAAARVSAALRARASGTATGGVPLFVATDQEGGQVQVLHGPGISEIPSALTQGTYSTGYLRQAATAWGRELRACGVNVDLAPVMDTVPSAAAAASNPPIGAFDREYGYTPATVASHGTAFAAGMETAGVAPVAKHFPGLGRVNANTDTSAGVTDRITQRGDPYLAPFGAAIDAGHAPFVMLSTAYYQHLDPANPAAFSPVVIDTLLRGDLRFRGVVISDDLANARQVAAWSPGERAVKFIDAGGDMVLTVNPDLLPAMYGAVLARVERDPTFRAKVDAAALRVLRAKVDYHLVGG